MSRVLFIVPPLTGHINPTLAVAAELTARGHEVAWVGHETVLSRLLPEGAERLPLDDRIPQALHDAMMAKAMGARGLVALKFLWQEFLVPLGRAMVPGLEAAVQAYAPDCLAVDQQALAGGIVARRFELPWATLATTSAAVTDSLAALPRVAAWVDEQLALLQREHGLTPLPGHNISPHAVIVFSTDALVGPLDRFQAHYHFVGPSLRQREERDDFPWQQLAPERSRVLVSLGTVNAERGRRFYRAVVDGLRDEPLQVIFAAPPELIGELPPHMLVRAHVPQLRLLSHVQAVISHGGHNTVCETLSHGLPLVVAPIRDDQPVVAEQVVTANAGVRVRFARVGPAGIRRAVRRVLDDPTFAAGARRVQASFRTAGGAAAAARVIEGLR